MSPVDRSWMGKKNEAPLIQSSGANGQKEIPLGRPRKRSDTERCSELTGNYVYGSILMVEY